MVVVIDPKSIGKKGSAPKLQTINHNKMMRIKRIHDDLDRAYIEQNTKKRADLLGIPYIDLYGFPIDTQVLTLISGKAVKRYKMGIFSMQNKNLMLATPDINDPSHAELLNLLKEKGFATKVYLCSYYSLKKLIKTYDQLVEHRAASDEVDLTESKIEAYAQHVKDIRAFEQFSKTLNTSEIIDAMFAAAVVNNASDIHLEPEKDDYHIRFRLDGILQTFATLSTEVQKKIESRIKLLSHLKLNVDNVPQDGRFTFTYKSNPIDVRVSMLPSSYGYSVVMRLLGTGNVALDPQSLGFIGQSDLIVKRSLTKPQGMILTTGPTGSGKTTTLYTFLSSLNDGQKKIITLEDPIEYKLEGISQTQIDAESGYTFAGGLKSILRQDPDVVMIGEIRDRETSEIAIQAALTGHQVLSTIHTNDAAGAIPRLLEMGSKGYLLADALQAIIGQRLVRKLCPHCIVEDKLSEEDHKFVMKQLTSLPPQARDLLPENFTFKTSQGCEHCNGMKYKGRIGIYEVISMTPSIRDIMETRPRTSQIRAAAAQDGTVTMLQDGIIKALMGITDIAEVLRVANF